MRARSALGVACVLAALAVSAPAAAQFTPQRLVLTGAAGCLHVPPCSGTICSAATETCMPLTSTAGVTSTALCVAPTSVYCCTSVVDCPLLPVGSGVSITCDRLTSGGVDTGICNYGKPLCLGVGMGNDLEHIARCLDARQCMATPPPFVAGSWAAGDCDCDGTPNGSEVHVDPFGDSCICDAAASCPLPDAGVLDLGVADLGAADLGAADLGRVGLDGAPADGPPGVDLGTPDAGDTPFDAGAVAMDAAVTPPGTSFRGAGGCVCGVGAPSGGAPAWAGVAALALLALPRLRRRAA